MSAGRPLRLRRSELFASLGYLPHRGQVEVHRSRARHRVVACGTRWGKSTLAVYETIAELLEPRERALGWIVAPTYELTKRTFERVVEVLQEKLNHRVSFYNRQGHQIVVVNLGGGLSELRARSADRPAGLLGEGLDFLVVDEAANVRDDVYDEHLAARLVDRKGKGLLLSTPGGPDWFYKQYRRGQRGKDPEYASFAMPTWTNPHVPKDVIEAEKKRIGGKLFEQQYGAEFQDIENYPCETCGGPSKEVVSHTIVLVNDEKPLRCVDCGRLVGEDGKTRVILFPNGTPYTMVVVLQDLDGQKVEGAKVPCIAPKPGTPPRAQPQ